MPDPHVGAKRTVKLGTGNYGSEGLEVWGEEDVSSLSTREQTQDAIIRRLDMKIEAFKAKHTGKSELPKPVPTPVPTVPAFTLPALPKPAPTPVTPQVHTPVSTEIPKTQNVQNIPKIHDTPKTPTTQPTIPPSKPSTEIPTQPGSLAAYTLEKLSADLDALQWTQQQSKKGFWLFWDKVPKQTKEKLAGLIATAASKYVKLDGYNYARSPGEGTFLNRYAIRPAAMETKAP